MYKCLQIRATGPIFNVNEDIEFEMLAKKFHTSCFAKRLWTNNPENRSKLSFSVFHFCICCHQIPRYTKICSSRSGCVEKHPNLTYQLKKAFKALGIYCCWVYVHLCQNPVARKKFSYRPSQHIQWVVNSQHLPTACVMNWLRAASLSWFSQDISSILHPCDTIQLSLLSKFISRNLCFPETTSASDTFATSIEWITLRAAPLSRKSAGSSSRSHDPSHGPFHTWTLNLPSHFSHFRDRTSGDCRECPNPLALPSFMMR